MRHVTVAWLYGAAWMYIATGAALTRYAKLLDVPPFGFGILAAIPFLSAGVQLPASYWIERHGGRKWVFFWGALGHRLLWVVIGLLPLMCPQSWWWSGLLGLMTAASMLGHASTPAWMAWMADLVPARLRGRYFSRRSQLGQAVGLVTTIIVGLTMDWSQGQSLELLLNTISILLIIAGCLGMLDIVQFLPIPDRHASRPATEPFGWRALVAEPLANREFRLFLGYSATMTFATGFIAQFIWLFVFDVVGFTNTEANLALVTVPLIIGMVAYPAWGRAFDRFGVKTIMLTAGILVVNGATPWLLTTRSTLLWTYPLILLATFAWAGMDIAGFNMLLRLSTSGRKGRAGNSAYVAINSVVVAIAGTLSGLFGGAVAAGLGDDWRGSLFGWPLTYHGVLILVSAVLRAASLLWVVGLEGQGAVAPRAAIRFVAAHVYSNLQQGIFMSVRTAGRLGQFTYKIATRRG